MSKQKRLPKIGVVSAPTGRGVTWNYWWRLVGGNGQIICVSEMFTNRTDARRAMRRAIQIIQSGQYKVEE